MLSAIVDDGAEFEILDIDHYWNVTCGKETAGEEFFDIADMYGYERASLIRDTHCGKNFEADLEDYLNDESSDGRENGMDSDCVYSFDPEECREYPECGKLVRVSG